MSGVRGSKQMQQKRKTHFEPHKPEFVVYHILANEVVAGPKAKQSPIRGSRASDLASFRLLGTLKNACLLLLQLNTEIGQVRHDHLVISSLVQTAHLE